MDNSARQAPCRRDSLSLLSTVREFANFAPYN
jgi:hypothetical protein